MVLPQGKYAIFANWNNQFYNYMRKSYIFIALVMVAILSTVSCKNRNSNQEPTTEDVQEQKVALSDTVLAKIDSLAINYFDAKDGAFTIFNRVLTDANVMEKPDYLLDPSVANTLVTGSQKINAMAIYCIDYAVRKVYEMPVEETKEAIAKLSLDLGHFISTDEYDSGEPISSLISKAYQRHKEDGILNSFWQLEYAMLAEMDYVIASAPGLFFFKISDEQWVNTAKAWGELLAAIAELAQYDEEMAALLEGYNEMNIITSEEDIVKFSSSKASAKQFYIDNYDKIAARRNALLQ